MNEQNKRTADDVVDGLLPNSKGPSPEQPQAPTTPGASEGPPDDDGVDENERGAGPKRSR